MEWLNKFISSFAAEDHYQYRDQKDVYRDIQQGNIGVNQDKTTPTSQQGGGEVEETHREDGVNEETGEEFEVEVHKYSLKPKNPKDKQEKDWVSQEAIITITSLDDETRSIRSSLKDLCNGRYASLVSLSSKEIAKNLISKHKEIFGHIEASIASYSRAISANDGFRLAIAASTDGIIDSNDFIQIKDKIEPSQLDEFESMISNANIRQTSNTLNAKIDYYMNYIKDFQEYKTANINGLSHRVAAVTNELKPEVRKELVNRFKKDEILSKLTR